MRLYAAFHRRVDYLPHGPAIDFATRAALNGPWVLPAGPVTHAYLVVDLGGGRMVRLDGEPPSSRLRVYREPDLSRGLWCAWEVEPYTDTEADAAWAAIERNTGVPYDFAEIANQLLPGMGRKAGIPHANICSALQLNVLSVMTGAKALVGEVSTLFPEALAQGLRRLEGREGSITRAW